MSVEVEALKRDLAELSSRVAELEGHRAILDLKSRYGALADARYTRRGPRSVEEIAPIADELASLFTEDAVWEGGGPVGTAKGREAIRARFREPTLHSSWHFFVKPWVEVSDERAKATWDVLAMITTTEGRAMWMVGVEHDEYRRVDGVWLHSRMRLDAQLMAPHEGGWAKSPSS